MKIFQSTVYNGNIFTLSFAFIDQSIRVEKKRTKNCFLLIGSSIETKDICNFILIVNRAFKTFNLYCIAEHIILSNSTVKMGTSRSIRLKMLDSRLWCKWYAGLLFVLFLFWVPIKNLVSKEVLYLRFICLCLAIKIVKILSTHQQRRSIFYMYTYSTNCLPKVDMRFTYIPCEIDCIIVRRL